MKKIICSLFISLFFIGLQAQMAQPDRYETKKGNLNIQPLFHASLSMTWNSKTIYVDPSGIENFDVNYAKADVVFITDIHGDHLNIKSLKSIITPKTIIILPLAAKLKLASEALPNKLIVMRNGEKNQLLGIKIQAIAMYNLPITADAKHIKGRGNGYVLNFGGKCVYISGDTADIEEMRTLKNIDIAFVCMNLPYTMTVEQAASAVLEFKPKIVYPFHYRGNAGFSDIDQFKALVTNGNKSIQVILKNWYPDQKQ